MLGEALKGLFRWVLKALLCVIAAQAALVAGLEAAGRVRRGLRRCLRGGPSEGGREGFAWQQREEIELESGGARLKLYTQGEELYEEMLEEITRAERNVFLGTFIWKEDEWGRRFVEALAEKARQGVEVYVVFDGLANVLVPAGFKDFPKEIGALHFHNLSTPRSATNPRNVFRHHRHYMSVDGWVAFLGGFNIGSVYARTWRDTHVRIEGEEVRQAENYFADFWNAHRDPSQPEMSPPSRRHLGSDVKLHRNDPYMRIFPIRAVYLEALDRANEYVYLTHAYFVPDRAIKAAMTEAVKRGVDVQVMVPKESDKPTLDWLARGHFGDLLEAGVRIFAYDERYMLHAKTITMDGLWSMVGSANLDSLSHQSMYEINLEIHSARLARQMEEVFELDKTEAEEITPEVWEKRPYLAKILEQTLVPLRPLI